MLLNMSDTAIIVLTIISLQTTALYNLISITFFKLFIKVAANSIVYTAVVILEHEVK